MGGRSIGSLAPNALLTATRSKWSSPSVLRYSIYSAKLEPVSGGQRRAPSRL